MVLISPFTLFVKTKPCCRILKTLFHPVSNSRNFNQTELTKSHFENHMSCSDKTTKNIFKQYFKVYENFVTELEESELMKEIEPIFKRRRYQYDHWDGAIVGYRETEKLEWNKENSKILQRLMKLCFSQNTVPIRQVHVLDLAKNGYIKPHVDSIKFCGDTIAGISLLSSCVMRFVYVKNKCVADCLIPRRSLYIMKNSVRYDFTHEVLEENISYFKEKSIPRDRRISVICRNEPQHES